MSDPPPGRRVAAKTATAVAALLVLVVLVTPSRYDDLTPGAFLRVPLEAIVAAFAVLVLPPRARGPAVAVGGIFLGAVAVVKILDLGFDAVLHRPFDPVLDWPMFGPAFDYLASTSGHLWAVATAVVAAATATTLLVLCTLAAARLGRTVVRYRSGAIRAVAVLLAMWLTLAVPGAQFTSGVPVASADTAVFVRDHAGRVRASLHDSAEFAAAATTDRFRDVPGDRLLTALRGKDVVLVFVESFGRTAVEDAGVAAELDEGTARLRAAGFRSVSGYLSSPTAGGGSWLAHATLLSGLWVDNQQRYRALVAGDRLTLPGAFHRAGWRTVGVMPGITRAWPEGAFFGYDRVYAETDLGYRGPKFGYATMPDQYVLAEFERRERTRPAPLMAVVPVLASHAPWSPIPRPVDWAEVGDGSIFHSMPSGGSAPEAIRTRDPADVRADYLHSIEYAVGTLVSYVETHGDDDLVLIMLGDHQPARVVTGPTTNNDVPITIAAHDPTVLDRIAPWSWTDGLRPAPTAPTRPMDTFRDDFLTAFGPLDATR